MKKHYNFKLLLVLSIITLFSINAKSQCTPNAGGEIIACGNINGGSYNLSESSLTNPDNNALWTVFSGGSVNFAGSENSINPYINVSTIGTYKLVLHESGTCSGTDTLTITFIDDGSLVYPGNDDAICGIEYQLDAMSSGNTDWWVCHNDYISFEDTLNSTSMIYLDTIGLDWSDSSMVEAVLYYKTDFGTCISSSKINITFYQTPNANAGFDDTYCSNCYQLNATPSIEAYDGHWIVLSQPTGSNIIFGSGSLSDQEQPIVNTCFDNSGIYEFIWYESNMYNNFCFSSDTVKIEPTIQIIDDTISDAYNGVCDGFIELSYTGGYPNPTIEWSNGDSTLDINNLCPNTYTIIITDTSNCYAEVPYVIEMIPDTSSTPYIDTITVVIDTCLFNTSIPIDSASIYDFEIISADSAITNWVFWQAGTAIYLDVTVPYTSGTNLIYLQIVCLNKATNIYKFYGVFNSTSVEIINIKKIINVEIYPNPAKDFVNIKVNNNELSKISVIDISGKILKTENFNNNLKIETKKFEKGIYIFKIETNNEVITKRIVID